MAIDMIEDNELGALAHSRIGGNIGFVDENHITPYRSFSGDEGFFNLFGSQKRKNSIEDVRKETDAMWAKYSTDTCDDLQKLLDAIGIHIETNTKLLATSNNFAIPVVIEQSRQWEGKIKAMKSDRRCDELAAQKRIEDERSSSLAALTNISDTSVEKAKSDLAGVVSTVKGAAETVGGVNKNLLIYGGIGLAGLVVLAIVLRR